MFVARFTNILCKIMYNQYPMSYYWGTDGRTDGRTDWRRFLNELRLRALAPGGARILVSFGGGFCQTDTQSIIFDFERKFRCECSLPN